MNKIIAIVGPTAVGKTKYAIEIAKAFNGEIISCDSMQLYKYMDIGSAKPTKEELAQVKHYLVDEINPRENFSVAQYSKMAKSAISEVLEKGKTPIVSGGTGLYLNSILYEMDFAKAPQNFKLREEIEKEAEQFGSEYIYNRLKEKSPEMARRIHPNNKQKLIRALEVAISGNKVEDFKKCQEKCKKFNPILIGLTRNRDELYDRINRRVDTMVQKGIFQEVEHLSELGLSENDISMKGIGYKEIIGYMNGLYTKEEAVLLIKKNSRHLAKRQLTWFRRYDEMNWFNLTNYSSEEDGIKDILLWLRK